MKIRFNRDYALDDKAPRYSVWVWKGRHHMELYFHCWGLSHLAWLVESIMNGFDSVGYGPLFGGLASLLYVAIYMWAKTIWRKRKESKPVFVTGDAKPLKFNHALSKAVGSTHLPWRKRCSQWLSWKKRRHEIKAEIVCPPLSATAPVGKKSTWEKKIALIIAIPASVLLVASLLNVFK